MKKTTRERVAALTPRLRQVVRLTSLGCTLEETAAILKIARNTADNHRTRAMRVLGTRRAVLLTRIAIKYRISPLTDKLTASEKRAIRKPRKPSRKR